MVLVITFSELCYQGYSHVLPESFGILLLSSWWNEILFWVPCMIPAYLIFAVLFYISAKVAVIGFKILICFLCIVHIALFMYFSTSMNLLGADLFSYSTGDIKQTLGASGVLNFFTVSIFLLIIAGCIWVLAKLPKYVTPATYVYILPIVAFLFGFSTCFISNKSTAFKKVYTQQLVANKPAYFFGAAYTYFFSVNYSGIDIYSDAYAGINTSGNVIENFDYLNPDTYPFYRTDNTRNVLSPFFNLQGHKPNMVIIIVEGLGRAFSNESAYLGSFTPFLDSLSQKSLYWKNCLSTSGRTFEVLPSLLGSLPYAKNGFLELDQKMPEHISLINLLKHNGYITSFYYGGDASFDHMNVFLKQNRIEHLIDQSSFNSKGTLLPATKGFTWGYDDRSLYNEFLSRTPENDSLRAKLSILLTVSSHNPFKINQAEKYHEMFQKHLNTLHPDAKQRKEYETYKEQYVSILYTDDMLRLFFNEYKKRADFKNSIFLITGDHRMPEIPMATEIDRYHVPLILYSPLLKRTETIASVSSHLDVTPSLLALLKSEYGIELPENISWMGSGLDTVSTFRNIHKIPFMQSKVLMQDFVMGNYLLHGNDVYQLSDDMEAYLQDNAKEKEQLKAAFDFFKLKNDQILHGKKIIPDSVYLRFSN